MDCGSGLGRRSRFGAAAGCSAAHISAALRRNPPKRERRAAGGAEDGHALTHAHPLRQVIYLPSATARPVSPTPVTPTATPFPTLSIARFYPVPDGNPLTGLPADPTLLERRPVAVKISTFPRGVRAYQSGLSLADVAYEYYIEDGLTRFAAVFYGQNAFRAGPVRSGRYFDEHILRMYQAVLVFANADERVETYLINQADLASVPVRAAPR